MPGGPLSRPITAKDAHDALELMQLPHVEVATIRQWANRGQVRKYGLDEQGRQKYEFSDILRQVSAHD